MAKPKNDEVAEAIEEEAAPAAELEVRGKPRKNDRPQSPAMVPNSTMGSRAGRTKPVKVSDDSENTRFSDRADARNKRVSAAQTTSK